MLLLLACVDSPFGAQSSPSAEPADRVATPHVGAGSRGRMLFGKSFTAAEGLGPEFNAVSCASCHADPRPGGSGRTKDALVEWAYGDRSDALGAPRQRFAVSSTGATIRIPSNTHEKRRTPSLFGLGQLEAIAGEELLSRSDPFDRDRDGISGRFPRRDDCFGRFGWQSTVCDIQSFVGGALANELGISVFPRSKREISTSDVSDLAAYVRGLARPARPVSDDGADLFESAQCASCHRPVTGVATIAGREHAVTAYTDLLLHEMGHGPRTGENDSRTEFRTPALWGVAATGPYLHDGSARTLEEAIRQHGGEATESRRRFVHLTAHNRERLLRFVATR